MPDTDASCSSWLNQLPTLPIGYSYRCSATPTNIDGTGWIPINFSASSLVNLQKPPIDPINKPPYYYTYVVGGSYKLSAKPEKNYDSAIKDGGIDPLLYEAGTNKNLNTFQSGLVLYLPFDEGTGTIAYDYSGFGNNGIIIPSGWVDGEFNKAVAFDGVNDYINLGTPTSLKSIYAPITIEAWVYPISGSGAKTIFTDRTSSYGQYLLWINGSTLQYYFYDGSAWRGFSGPTVPINQWSYVAVTNDGTNIRLYVNTASTSYTTSYYPTSSPGRVGIGAPPDYIYRYDFLGTIDEVRVYNRALPPDEINYNYNNPLTPYSTSGLVGWWHLDEGTGTIAYDSSGNNNNGTLTNISPPPQWTDGKVNKALSFDGVDDYVYRNTFVGTPSSYFTICFWINTTLSDTYIFQLNRSPSNYFYELISTISTGKLQFLDYSTTLGFSNTQTSINSINNGNWRFGCFVKSKTIGNYYIDGEFDSQVSASVDVRYGSNDFVIGGDYRNKAPFFYGFIDEVRIYNRALSADEVKALYDATE